MNNMIPFRKIEGVCLSQKVVYEDTTLCVNSSYLWGLE